ncbi:MAG: Holliday junction DNA helicase RuvA [Lentisphaerae bacterium GWF2_44_16]|nr:MAG: Holliday junction DNA helicase RuvA [Lentisphaerae bacterium GWF2_44_16]
MIARIRGKLLEAALTEIIVDVNGIGYRIFIPLSTYDKLPRPGENVDILTYTHVREDAIQLFGFATKEEKELFELLITVNGIGVKSAANIMSGMPVSSFCNAIASADIKVLSKINGIGKKTAERLVVELRDKVSKITTGVYTESKLPDTKARSVEDALLALEQLGFKRDKAQKTVIEIAEALDEKEASSENIIRKALQKLNS